jgi:large-conductance mechanosensitive channel
LEKSGNVTDFSYILNQDPNSVPDNISDGNDTSVTFNNIGDGILYFHAKAKENNTWGGTSHYPIRIDTASPTAFKIRIEKMGFPTSQNFFAYFDAKDSLSGIDYYEISVTNMSDPQALSSLFFIETASPYQIPFEKSGKYAVTVRAYDKAGNFTEDTATLSVVSQLFSYTEEGLRIKNFLIPVLLMYLIGACILFLIVFFINRYLKRRGLAKRLKTEVAEAEKEIEDVKKLEKRIQDMRGLEEEAKRESERLAGKLHNQDTNQNA